MYCFWRTGAYSQTFCRNLFLQYYVTRVRHDKQIRRETGKDELTHQTIKTSMNEKEALGLEFLTVKRKYDIPDILLFNT